MNGKRMFRTIFVAIALAIVCFGCSYFQAPDSFTAKEKVEYTSLRTLEAAKTFRTVGLEAAGAVYKAGAMDEKTKGKIIEIGDDLQEAINTAADALIAYKTMTDELADTSTLEAKIAAYQKVFNEFMELVTPYLTTTTTTTES